MTLNEIAASIRGRRIDIGMSQADLARRAGVSRKWIYEFEAGKSSAEFGLLLKVLDVLGLELSLEEKPAVSEAAATGNSVGDAGSARRAGASGGRPSLVALLKHAGYKNALGASQIDTSNALANAAKFGQSNALASAAAQAAKFGRSNALAPAAAQAAKFGRSNALAPAAAQAAKLGRSSALTDATKQVARSQNKHAIPASVAALGLLSSANVNAPSARSRSGISSQPTFAALVATNKYRSAFSASRIDPTKLLPPDACERDEKSR